MNIVSVISSLIIIVGCFMPWIQLGALFANRGIDNPDGAIMLVAGIISGAVAIHNTSKNQEKNTWVFIVVGILGGIVAYLDLSEVRDRAADVAQGFTELSEYVGARKHISSSNFVGSGLYIVAAGSVGLFLCGIGVFGSSNQPAVTGVSTSPNEEMEVVAPKYAKLDIPEEVNTLVKEERVKTPEEIENEQYKEKLNQLYLAIDTQKGRMIGGGMNDEIRNKLAELVTDKREGIHLLNSYSILFKRDLIQDLTKLNSSYAAARENVDLFVQLDIVEGVFPHKRK